MTKPIDRVIRFVVAAAAYLAFSLLWLYGILDEGHVDEESWFMWTVLAALAALHVLFGFLVREWVALLLPIAVVLVAVPAGYPESRYEPGLVWHGQMFLVLFEVPLLAAGLGLRALYDGRRRTLWPSR
jgi:hypothetical protein